DRAPEMVSGLDQLAAALAQKKEYGRAEQVALRAVAVNPYYLNPYRTLGSIYFETWRFDRSYHCLAIASYAEFRFPLARARWNQALAVSPGFAEARYGLSLALEAMGQPEQARAELARACELGSVRACEKGQAKGSRLPEP
ncbi:MAG: tetratricopeptide repeat protein, partial [Myxococcaceae bacterium]